MRRLDYKDLRAEFAGRIRRDQLAHGPGSSLGSIECCHWRNGKVRRQQEKQEATGKAGSKAIRYQGEGVNDLKFSEKNPVGRNNENRV